MLKEARKLGTFLLVGIQSDETVNTMRGQNLPIMNLHERALGVLSCRYVDEVAAGFGCLRCCCCGRRWCCDDGARFRFIFRFVFAQFY